MARPEGYCAICDAYGPLSFEHVPPRAAFNDKGVRFASFRDRLEASAKLSRPKQRQLQRGQGAHTLCESCNNNTGAWYGSRFVAWCADAMETLDRTGGEPTIIQVRYCYPLSILKQVLAMFCSVNEPRLASGHPSLTKFILDRHEQRLWPQLRVFTYYNLVGERRYAPFAGRMASNGFTMISELSFPPLGYVLTLGGAPPPDRRLFEITWFKDHRYDEFRQIEMRMPLLETHAPLAGDYRSKRELERDTQEGLRHLRNNEAAIKGGTR